MKRDLPEQFIAMLREAVGSDIAGELAHALASEAPSVSVRINEAKGAALPAEVAAVPWERQGFYLG